jgi:hypothetical protein
VELAPLDMDLGGSPAPDHLDAVAGLHPAACRRGDGDLAGLRRVAGADRVNVAGVLRHTLCNAVATPLLTHGHLTLRDHGDVLASPVLSAIVTMMIFAGAGLFWCAGVPGATTASR